MPARRAALGRPLRAARPARVRWAAAVRSAAALIKYGSIRQRTRTRQPSINRASTRASTTGHRSRPRRQQLNSQPSAFQENVRVHASPSQSA